MSKLLSHKKLLAKIKNRRHGIGGKFNFGSSITGVTPESVCEGVTHSIDNYHAMQFQYNKYNSIQYNTIPHKHNTTKHIM